jgi:ArsR family metal-binding transcriptional regulator
VNPETPVRLNLQDIAAMIEVDYKVILRTPMVLVFLYNGHEISLFEKGRMLIKNVHSEDEAHQISKAVAGIIGR